MTRKRSLTLVVIVVTVLISLFCLATYTNLFAGAWITRTSQQQVVPRSPSEGKPHGHGLQGMPSRELVSKPSRLLYLVQTESCLPSNLRSVEAIGNANTCQCDVLVLSYKQMCSDTPPAHVEYIFNSSTSWGMGRNLLFEVAKRRGEKYLYYIFMDDDVVLETKSLWEWFIDFLKRTVGVTINNPWRVFEDFLKRIEPAVGAVDVNSNPHLKDVYAAREQQGCILKEPSDYLPAAQFDPAFNAFHYQAVEHLLPYPCKFDSISWYYTELVVEVKREVMFAGQSVLHTQLIAKNPQHRNYGKFRRILPPASHWDMIVNEAKVGLPEKYQKANLLLEWKRDGLEHGKKSSAICLPPPPSQVPIKPFAYLDAKGEGN